MQIGEFIVRTVIYKALNQTGDILLFSESEKQAFIVPPLLFADFFLNLFIYINILLIFCRSSYFFAEQ